jgi:uncharacterized protein
MKTESLGPRIDVKSLAQSAGVVPGRTALSEFERLMHETQGLGGDRFMSWTARGDMPIDETGVGQIWLHLTAEVCLPLVCQRCLGPVDVTVSIDRSFRFVETEAQAEIEDEDSEEDVLALSAEFSLADLLEDEVLMELPAVPRHEECPVAVTLEVMDPGFEVASAEKANPFAVLAKMQKGRSE